MTTSISGTGEIFREWFEYRDGVLYWRKNPKSQNVLGKPAGRSNGRYMQVKLGGKEYLTHRVVFLMMNGFLPDYLDHINGNTFDNRIENLRPATARQNNWNRKISNRNTSGVKGVTFYQKINKWKGYIEMNRKNIHVGYFDKLEDAANAVALKRRELHGDFANLGVAA